MNNIGIIKERFSDIEISDGTKDSINIFSPTKDIFNLVNYLRNDQLQNYNFLSSITCVDYPARIERFEVIYNLYSTPKKLRIFLKVNVNCDDPELESIVPIFKGANWYEREIYDMFGIRFRNHPDLRRILNPSHWKGHPLRKDFTMGGEDVCFTGNKDKIVQQDLDFEEMSMDQKEIYAAIDTANNTGTRLLTIAGEEIQGNSFGLGKQRTILNMGPQHPSTHGLLRLVLDLEGERIKNVIPIIGYLHTGIEKNCEELSYQKAITLTDRLDYLNPLGNNLAYCLTVEKMLEIDIPARAQYGRVILCELTRISSHLVWLAAQSLDVGIMSLFFYCFNERELILDIFESVSGVRLMTSYINIGGLRWDIQDEFNEMVTKFIDHLPSKIDEFENLIHSNPIWIERTKGVGIISAGDALEHSISGPILRASGTNWDIRKAIPYSSYDHFDFNVPLGQNGDIYDRYMVRMEEMRQSLHIIRQALKIIPEGEYRSKDRKILTPPKEELNKSMESLIHHFLISTSGFPVPKGDAYTCVESPRGELGFYIVSDGGNNPYRVYVRAPSFANLQGLALASQGGMIADLVAIIGSFDPVLGEVDR